MLPVAPLMIEHRLIEKMILLIQIESERIKKSNEPDCDFILSAADFILEFTDKVHHGKEEEILFKILAKKNMTEDHKKIMDELLHEHARSRKLINEILDYRDLFLGGDQSAKNGLVKSMDSLLHLYTGHIEKEDKHFFIPVMAYFTDEERNDLLNEHNEFDRNFMKNRYKKIITNWGHKKITIKN